MLNTLFVADGSVAFPWHLFPYPRMRVAPRLKLITSPGTLTFLVCNALVSEIRFAEDRISIAGLKSSCVIICVDRSRLVV